METLHIADDEFNNREEMLVFRLGKDSEVGRLDKLLAQCLPQHSRGRLQKWIEAGFVWVNAKPAKVRQTVGPDDIIWVQEQASEEELAYQPQDIALNVVDQTPAYIVIHKPVGLVTHPGAGNWQGTLLNGLLYHFPELQHIPRAGIVHRLDKDTSGLLVVARTLEAQTHLVRQLQARTMGRQYVALVMGHTLDEGTVDKSIGRDPRKPIRMTCDRPIAPKPAVTHYETLARGELASRQIAQVRCHLETGRTHQIRVHLSSLNHPLVADTLYGGVCLAGATRQMLHAQRLQFQDPLTDELCCFETDLPEDMQALIQEAKWHD